MTMATGGRLTQIAARPCGRALGAQLVGRELARLGDINSKMYFGPESKDQCYSCLFLLQNPVYKASAIVDIVCSEGFRCAGRPTPNWKGRPRDWARRRALGACDWLRRIARLREADRSKPINST